MAVTSFSEIELNQDLDRAKQAARTGPVFITDRGQPTLVLLSMEEYMVLVKDKRTMADLISLPEVADLEFDPPRMEFIAQPVEFE